MKISIEKAKQICTKSQYGEATWWELLQLNVYLLFSKECSDFSAKNKKLTSLCERAGLDTLSEDDKDDMKKKLKELS
ncbi:hypothetical protein [Flagellimonas meridianipacifica]|uniref:Uncharacterized protein n=1 Tax=Flagellimonas meridianipacifica TaxID=1080225 RepID=A0A2T0M8A3_9FLAO|nr:hypothetical protein [Allomuricauda pacifica]PRX53652.1 hypothetical protein CLV81_2039 [Allomuricauda pacifica]